MYPSPGIYIMSQSRCIQYVYIYVSIRAYPNDFFHVNSWLVDPWKKEQQQPFSQNVEVLHGKNAIEFTRHFLIFDPNLFNGVVGV